MISSVCIPNQFILICALFPPTVYHFLNVRSYDFADIRRYNLYLYKGASYYDP